MRRKKHLFIILQIIKQKTLQIFIFEFTTLQNFSLRNDFPGELNLEDYV